MAAALGPQIANLKRRLHAWWDGRVYVPAGRDEVAPESVAAPAPAQGAAEALPVDAWNPQRVRVSELIWGDGFNCPGGAEAALDLMRPLDLAKGKTLLEFGCGLGGGARAVARTIGAAVDGLEPSATLAVAGMKLCEAAGLGKKVMIQNFDPRTGKLPAKRYDAVLVRQMLGLVTDKTATISALNACLKPGGHIMFVEYALAEAERDSPALAAWREMEDRVTSPPTLEFIAAALVHEKLDVRVAEDIAPESKAQILRGWARLAAELKGKEVAAEEKPLLARELELWARRIMACEAGDLRLARIHAIKRS